MSARVIGVLKFLGFLSIGGVILYLVFQSQSAAFAAQCAQDGVPADECSLLDKLANDLATVNYWWLLALLVIFMISNLFRAHRWQQLIEPLGTKVRFWNAFWSVMIGYLANLGLPRAGEVVRAGVLGRYEGVAVEKVMGTVVVDRLLDVLCLLIIMGFAFVVKWDTLSSFVTESTAGTSGGSKATLLAIAAAILVAGLGVAFWAYRKFAHLAIVQKIATLAAGFIAGLRSLTEVRRPGVLVANTIGIWGCYFLMAYIPFFAFPPTAHLGVDAALMVFVFSALGIIVPSPGGLGSYHLMVIQALALYDIPGDDALSFANILFFTINIGCNIIFGILGLLVLPGMNGGKKVDMTTEVVEEPNAATVQA